MLTYLFELSIVECSAVLPWQGLFPVVLPLLALSRSTKSQFGSLAGRGWVGGGLHPPSLLRWVTKLHIVRAVQILRAIYTMLAFTTSGPSCDAILAFLTCYIGCCPLLLQVLAYNDKLDDYDLLN